jgi:hypothetical protein
MSVVARSVPGTNRFTAGEDLEIGHIVSFNADGEVVKTSSIFSLAIYEVVGVSLANVASGEAVTVSSLSDLVGVLFAAPPAASSNGSYAYLSTGGKATLNPDTASGKAIVILGILHGADGVSTTPTVLLRPQYISRVP